MERLIKAFGNSMRAFSTLMRNEKAFQQEIALLVVSAPAAWFLASSWPGFALLVGSLLVLILVEVLNTAIEATCDAVSGDFDSHIRLAKDCGSLAVLISVVLVLGVWGVAVADRIVAAH